MSLSVETLRVDGYEQVLHGTDPTVGLIAIIIASIVNIFIGSGLFAMVISALAIIIFLGLTAYDTQKIKESAELEFHGSEIATKGAILGALTLYLDFINLFIFTLRLLGGRRD